MIIIITVVLRPRLPPRLSTIDPETYELSVLEV